MTPWEKVDSPRSYDDVPTLTIYQDANGRINATADKEWFADFEEATFWVDVEDDQLGITPGDEGHSYSLSRSGDRVGADITTKTTLGRFGITPEDIDETVHLDLDTAEAPPTSDAEVFVVADVSPLLDGQGTVEGDQETTAEDTPEANSEESGEDETEELYCGRCGDGPFEGTQGLAIHNGRSHDGEVQVAHSPAEAEDEGESDDADDQTDDGDEEADAGGTHDDEPNPTTSPDHERVHHAIDEEGVTSVHELADVLDETVGRARTLARVTDRYGELDDKPSDGVRA